MEPAVSILIATQGRVPQLQRLLDGLLGLENREEIPHEILVANNAQDKTIVRAVEALLQNYRAHEPERWIHVREPVPGKSRALNRLLPLAKANLLGFLDDDVEVAPEWLRRTWQFFRDYSYDVMQGSILIPPSMQNDERFLGLLNRYRTICYYSKPGLEVREIVSLNAANIALRKELLDVTGLFDERIGPGASGTSMDVEFGERVLRMGRRIGYEPRSVVYHDVDWGRLTEAYFKQRHELQGRSRAIYKGSGVFSSLANLLRAGFGFCLYTALRDERKIYRSKGRIYHYRAMLKEASRTTLGPLLAASSTPSGPPAVNERETRESKSS
jgi:cellulose synthase/poly-beta-1,6-N-acetylglucosamine synthase-like glycosyltransferase